MRAFLLLALLLQVPASASETIVYSYDPSGRLTKVTRSGSVNNGVNACYVYDKADNRSNVTVATGDCGAPPPVPLSLAIGDAEAFEGQNLVFTVQRFGSTSSSISVNFATANGTALSTTDYFSTSGTLTFGPTETSKTITVATRTNTTPEADENFFVNLSGATGGATITDVQGVGTIIDND